MIKLFADIFGIVFAVSIHEFSHAWMADRLGDPTGRIYGRLTLNPLKHFDLFGTLSLLFFGIGWGKPVPFNPENLRYPKRDSALIGLAGPLSNFLTALALAAVLNYLSKSGFMPPPAVVSPMASAAAQLPYLFYFMAQSLFTISIVLFALNVLPFPPFDGSKIIGIFVPARYHRRYEYFLSEGVKYVVLFILFDVLVIERMIGFSILHYVVVNMTTFIMAVISIGM